VYLSISVQRTALKTPPPFGRTLSFPKSAVRLCEVRTPAPKQVWVPFRRFRPVAEGVGRDGTPVGQCMVRHPIASEKFIVSVWSAAMYSACC
jgi:hypothetical protein